MTFELEKAVRIEMAFVVVLTWVVLGSARNELMSLELGDPRCVKALTSRDTVIRITGSSWSSRP